MKQYEGRSGKPVTLLALVVLGVSACLVSTGCNPGDATTAGAPEIVPPDDTMQVTYVQPAQFYPGSFIEISGQNLPKSLDDVRVRFRSVQDQASLGIPGAVARNTGNLLEVQHWSGSNG